MEGLMRGRAGERERARGRLLGITTLTAVAAVGAMAGLCVGLPPEHAGAQPPLQQAPDGSRRPAHPGTAGPHQEVDGPPVATSGGS